MQVYCPHRLEGCKEYTSYKLMQVHLKTKCLFEIVSCDYKNRGCKETMKRSDLNDHSKGKCMYTYMCDCGRSFKYGRDEHYACISNMKEEIQELNKKIAAAKKVIARTVIKERENKSELIPISNLNEEVKVLVHKSTKPLETQTDKGSLTKKVEESKIIPKEVSSPPQILKTDSEGTTLAMSPLKNPITPQSEEQAECEVCHQQILSSKLQEHMSNHKSGKVVLETFVSRMERIIGESPMSNNKP